jgi:hypothetical protein
MRTNNGLDVGAITRRGGDQRDWQATMKERAQRSLWWLSVVGVVALAEWTVVQVLASPV